MSRARAAKASPVKKNARTATKPTPKRTASPTKSTPKRTASATTAARRSDFGSPIEGMLAKQPSNIRAILVALRQLIEKAAPEATASLKWGMPFFSIGQGMMCALGAHKAHVNLVLPGAPTDYKDPDGLLEGESEHGRRLKVKNVDDLPTKHIRAWLRVAALRAKKGAKMR